jgi:hypothetical protein
LCVMRCALCVVRCALCVVRYALCVVLMVMRVSMDMVSRFLGPLRKGLQRYCVQSHK